MLGLHTDVLIPVQSIRHGVRLLAKIEELMERTANQPAITIKLQATAFQQNLIGKRIGVCVHIVNDSVVTLVHDSELGPTHKVIVHIIQMFDYWEFHRLYSGLTSIRSNVLSGCHPVNPFLALK